MTGTGSPFFITGKLVGIDFYVDDGINVALRAGGGFNRRDIKTRPEMRGVRENNGEFGHCSKVKSVFMRALWPYFVGIRGRRIRYEKVGMFTPVKERDAISGRGERTLGFCSAKCPSFSCGRVFCSGRGRPRAADPGPVPTGGGKGPAYRFSWGTFLSGGKRGIPHAGGGQGCRGRRGRLKIG